MEIIMIIDNVLVYTEDKEFVKGGIVLENDTIKSVYKDSEKIKVDNNEIIDGNGAFAIPGLIFFISYICNTNYAIHYILTSGLTINLYKIIIHFLNNKYFYAQSFSLLYQIIINKEYNANEIFIIYFLAEVEK